MAKINAFLIHYQGGWTEAVNFVSVATNGRREALLSLGAVADETTAVAIGAEALVLLAGDRQTLTVEVDPAALADAAFFGYEVGDTIPVDGEFSGTNNERVLAVKITGTDQGYTETPQLRDVLLENDDRVQRWLKSMSQGAVGGSTTAATPEPHVPPPALPPAPPRTINITAPEPIELGVSKPWTADVNCDLRQFHLGLDVAGSTDTVARLVIVGVFPFPTDVVPNSEVTIPAGAVSAAVFVSQLILVNQRIAMQVLSIGTDAEKLQGQIRVANRT